MTERLCFLDSTLLHFPVGGLKCERGWHMSDRNSQYFFSPIHVHYICVLNDGRMYVNYWWHQCMMRGQWTCYSAFCHWLPQSLLIFSNEPQFRSILSTHLVKKTSHVAFCNNLVYFCLQFSCHTEFRLSDPLVHTIYAKKNPSNAKFIEL